MSRVDIVVFILTSTLVGGLVGYLLPLIFTEANSQGTDHIWVWVYIGTVMGGLIGTLATILMNIGTKRKCDS